MQRAAAIIAIVAIIAILGCGDAPPQPAPTAPPVAVAPATPAPTYTPLSTNTPIPAPTDTPLPTNTPVPAPTNTPLPTNTPVPAPTDTPLPTNTPEPTPTNTPLPPTSAPEPTPTETPLPPTNTPAPAPTNTPEPTPTSAPEPAPTDTPTPAPTNTPEPTPTETTPPTATPEPVAGNAVDNPVPATELGAPANTDGIGLRVINAIRGPGAEFALLQEPLENERPTVGFTFVMVRVQVENSGEANKNYHADVRLSAIGRSGAVYRNSGGKSECGEVPFEYDSLRSIEPGGRLRGNVCFVVTTEDAETLTLFDNGGLTGSYDDWRYWEIPNKHKIVDVNMNGRTGQSPDNPFRFKQLGSLANTEELNMRLQSVKQGGEALSLILSEAFRNDEPPMGYRYILILIDVHNFGIDLTQYDPKRRLKVFSESGALHENWGESDCGKVPRGFPGKWDIGTRAPRTGHVCFIVPAGDAGKLTLFDDGGPDGDQTDWRFWELRR